MDTLTCTLRPDGVALISIDLPGRPHEETPGRPKFPHSPSGGLTQSGRSGGSVNVFTDAFVADLEAAVEQVLADPAARGAVITSAKRGFIAGADLTRLARAFDDGITAVQASHRFDRENALLRRIETGGKPFACALNGLALGGGLELALACHHRVLADASDARIGLPEVTLGLLPAGGGTQRLPRLIGIEAALPVLVQGRPLTPQQALAQGIVHALAPREALVEQAAQWVLAHPHARQPWDVEGFRVPGGVGCLAPHAIASFQHGTTRARRQGAGRLPAPLAILSAVFEGTQLPFDQGVRIEAQCFGALLADPVSRNLIRTNFIHKGEADRLVRRPADVPREPVRRLGVFGGGMMGAGIAQVALQAGIEVVLIETDAAAAQRAADRIRAALHKQGAADAAARLQATTDTALLAGADLVIEAVFERHDVKQAVIRQAAAVLPPQAFFASNTSTLPITRLAQAFPREDAFIGLHFFSPVDRMPLVEVVRGRATSDATLARALDFIAQLRKTPIVVHDSPGFYTSRVFGTYVDEGMAMLAEGVQPALIENAARLAGFPIGPLAVCDEVTIALQLEVHEQALAEGLAAPFQRLTAIGVVKTMVALGRIGRRAGAGFYDYPADSAKRLWPGLASQFPPSSHQPDVDTVQQRLLAIQALETVRCLDEGVLTHPADADLGAVLGIGYPAWTGGTLSYIETVGLPAFIDACNALAERHGERFRPPAGLLERAAQSGRFHG